MVRGHFLYATYLNELSRRSKPAASTLVPSTMWSSTAPWIDSFHSSTTFANQAWPSQRNRRCLRTSDTMSRGRLLRRSPMGWALLSSCSDPPWLRRQPRGRKGDLCYSCFPSSSSALAFPSSLLCRSSPSPVSGGGSGSPLTTAIVVLGRLSTVGSHYGAAMKKDHRQGRCVVKLIPVRVAARADSPRSLDVQTERNAPTVEQEPRLCRSKRWPLYRKLESQSNRLALELPTSRRPRPGDRGAAHSRSPRGATTT